MPDPWLRALTDAHLAALRDRTLLVLAKPAAAAGDRRWDMGGWTLDATDLPDGALARGAPIWIVGDHLALQDTDGGRRATLHGVTALRRLLP